MQLRRAAEIVNSKNNDTSIYYKDKQVHIISIDNNIGTAYVEAVHDNVKFEVDLEMLTEKNKYV